ncbi:hypothetical protein WA026_017471 [Henosepilachna vigintioctopunctata]|uniref:Uncharacterized protein n=1 Tax=Henosepilachna vigintioctopunctata TaxID=420089 RepID=A0AAW1VDV2_9CUCU
MTTFIDKPVSLLERKKRQWAQERDELEHLWAPWGNKQYNNSTSNIGRQQFNTKITTSNQSYHRRESTSQESNRKNSLPPLNKNLYNSNEKFEKGSETSGYASDNANQVQEYLLPQPIWNNQTQNQSGYESSSSRDDRPKWKDKVVNSEQFWENPKSGDDCNGNEPQIGSKGDWSKVDILK